MANEMLWKKEDLHEVDWVKEQTKSALSSLQKEVLYTKDGDEVKFDVDTSLNYLKTLKDKKTYSEVMKDNPWATVMAVQILLKNKGYNIGKIDWILRTQWKATSTTMEAIAKFQRENWLTPDGAPGPDTIKKILEVYENWWWNAWATKPKAPNNPQQPKTPEKQQQLPEMTLEDVKKINRNLLWSFNKDGGFVFKKWVEKSDSKWKYIVVNGKKLYEIGDNEDGLYYRVADDFLVYGQYKKGERNWRWGAEFSDWMKLVGQWENGKMEWQWTITYSNWDKYVGQWKNGKRWTWKIFAKDGKTVFETWVNGKKVN